MGSLSDRLENYVKSVELNGDAPLSIEQRWIVLSSEAGIRNLNSQYLLIPTDIFKELTEKLGLPIGSKNIKKFCHLAIEKNGDKLTLKVIYDFQIRPTWRPLI